MVGTESFNVVLLGFAIVLLDVLGDDETGVCELPDVGYVVILSQVHAESNTRQQGEAALYYSHLISPPPLSLSLQLSLLLLNFSGQQKEINEFAGVINKY